MHSTIMSYAFWMTVHASMHLDWKCVFLLNSHKIGIIHKEICFRIVRSCEAKMESFVYFRNNRGLLPPSLTEEVMFLVPFVRLCVCVCVCLSVCVLAAEQDSF